MNKSLAIFGLACCLCTATAGTLKAAAAEAISEVNDSKFEARGGPPPHHGGGHGGGHGGDHGGGGLGLSLGGGPGGWGGPGGGWGLGGGGGSPLHGNESFGGPTVIALALPIAIGLIIALWVAAYNTLRSPAPKIGYNAGIVESAGWGNQASSHVAGGYGWADAAASDPHSVSASNLATSAIVQAAATHGAAGAVATGRALDDLTHRVVKSIDSQEKKY